MRQISARVAPVIALILGAVLLASAAVPAEQASKPLRDDDVVARVNGTIIRRKAVRQVVQGILAVQDQQPDPEAIGKLAHDALDSLIALELLYQESQAQGVKVSDADIDAEIARSKSRFPNAAAFREAMKASGMTEADLRRDTRKTMAVNRFLEGGIWKNVQITPEEVKNFYEHNREEFRSPPQIRVSRILIRVPEGATAAERKTAKGEAETLLAKLKAGADFATLARAESQDTSSAPHGGDLGYIGKGEMEEAFEKAAFALTPGQISPVVETSYGYELIKVTDARGAGYTPLAEVKDRIEAVLLKSEKQQRQAALVAQLRKKAKIDFGGTGTHK